MNIAFQQTLRRQVSCAGIGLHSGSKVSLTLKPAPADTGVVFRRADLGVDIPANIEHVAAITGELFIDPTDLARTTGLVHVDLRELELFQRISGDDGKTFGEETRDETQNQHAREWLEIGPDAPPDQLQKNALIEFSLLSVQDLSATDLTKMSGAERKVTFTAVGDFLLHQRKASKSVALEAVFTWSGDHPSGVTIKSREPLSIGLDEYDVRPRSGFGKLAAKTLQALSPKVAKAAEVSLQFTAKLAPGSG